MFCGETVWGYVTLFFPRVFRLLHVEIIMWFCSVGGGYVSHCFLKGKLGLVLVHMCLSQFACCLWTVFNLWILRRQLAIFLGQFQGHWFHGVSRSCVLIESWP